MNRFRRRRKSPRIPEVRLLRNDPYFSLPDEAFSPSVWNPWGCCVWSYFVSVRIEGLAPTIISHTFTVLTRTAGDYLQNWIPPTLPYVGMISIYPMSFELTAQVLQTYRHTAVTGLRAEWKLYRCSLFNMC